MFFVNARAIIEREIGGKMHILLQTRNKAGEARRLELPGGRLELFEPILQALHREVLEETGLRLTEVEGADTRIDTAAISPDFVVECVRPFAVYQTVHGSIDSTGFYFRCRAEGEPLASGDDTVGAQWVDLATVAERMSADPLQFSSVDRAGIIFYLKERGGQR